MNSRPAIMCGVLLGVAAAGMTFADTAEEKVPDASDLSETQLKRLTRGYSQSVKDDVTYYCRSDAPLGSRLGKRQCFTVEQLVEMERVRVENQRRLERKQVQRETQGG